MKARRKSPGIRPNGTDPKKKKKNKGAKITRNKDGDLIQTKGENFYYSDEDKRETNRLMATRGDRTFEGAPAARVGGVKVEKTDGSVMGGTKPQLRMAKRRVRRSSASKAAKRSAIRLY